MSLSSKQTISVLMLMSVSIKQTIAMSVSNKQTSSLSFEKTKMSVSTSVCTGKFHFFGKSAGVKVVTNIMFARINAELL